MEVVARRHGEKFPSPSRNKTLAIEKIPRI
jgi:hypothetical protein